jgi:hypothetical protein
MQKLACTEEILHSTFVYKTDADTVFWHQRHYSWAVDTSAKAVNGEYYAKTLQNEYHHTYNFYCKFPI